MILGTSKKEDSSYANANCTHRCMYGDNRESSEDSRMADIGNVKRSEIEGKVWFILSPKDRFGLLGK